MRHKLGQQQKFQQKMSMTPQMRQSVQLLGMAAGDVAEYIEFAMSKNPFIQKIVEHKHDRKATRHSMADNDMPSFDAVNPEDIRASLLSQARMRCPDQEAERIVEYLIYEMDDNGYIKTEPEDAAQDLDAAVTDVELSLDIIKGMEPAGIGSSDIIECLQLQLKRKNMDDSIEYAIVSELMNEMAQDDVQKIAKKLNVSTDAARKAISNIRKLNPRPASGLLAKKSETVIPELIVKADKKRIRIEVNGHLLPKLKFYNPYENETDIIKDPEARKFLKENKSMAKGLIDNLKRREDTICKVTDYILNFQKDAILKSGGSLKTITIRDVATALNFHPSTICRAVSNKYIELNGKSTALSSLLSDGIKKHNGDVTSKAHIKDRIKALINSEDPHRPLRDEDIKSALESDGIPLNRRTVAKYRESLKILPSHLRRKA